MTTLGTRLLGSWPGTASDDIARELLRRYGEPHRHYHDIRHLAEVLAAVERLAPHADDLDAVRLAAWFHDAVYDPRAGDNEERSAALATAALPATLGERVAALVRHTATHEPVPGDADGAVLCDSDLSILAASPGRYGEYVAGVRQEYAHVPDHVFATTRGGVLTGLLARERLYLTETAFERWERSARANLRREVITLDGDAARRQ